MIGPDEDPKIECPGCGDESLSTIVNPPACTNEACDVNFGHYAILVNAEMWEEYAGDLTGRRVELRVNHDPYDSGE